VTRVSPWHGLWLLVFALDAVAPNRDRAHALGALALFVLFAVLTVSEHRSTRGRALDD
jgi:hypothetical protein